MWFQLTAQIKQWQADSPMEWIWERYQISSELYANTKPGQEIDEAYYQKYIPVIHKRIDQAAIRLAGELNKLFNTAAAPVITETPVTPAAAAIPVKLEDVKNNMGKTVSTQGKVYSSRDIGSIVLVNLGAAYPNQLLTIALKGAAKELKLEDKTITVEGEVIDYKGKPEIIITDPAKIKF
jgi:hypothetical protein